jgi:hypothetical protein
MATLVISYLHTLVYNPHKKALANCLGEFGRHVIKQNLSPPKGRLFWNVKCQLDCFHFLREKRKKKKFCQCFPQGNALRAGCYPTLMIGSDLTHGRFTPGNAPLGVYSASSLSPGFTLVTHWEAAHILLYI